MVCSNPLWVQRLALVVFIQQSTSNISSRGLVRRNLSPLQQLGQFRVTNVIFYEWRARSQTCLKTTRINYWTNHRRAQYLRFAALVCHCQFGRGLFGDSCALLGPKQLAVLNSAEPDGQQWHDNGNEISNSKSKKNTNIKTSTIETTTLQQQQ